MGDLDRNKNEVQEETIWGLGVSPVAWLCVVHSRLQSRVTSAHRSLWIPQVADLGFYIVL